MSWKLVRRFSVALVAAMSMGVVFAACGGDDASDAEPITVAAARSLQQVFPAIDPAPTYNFAGSNQLAEQIRQGAPADVFAAANARYPDELHADGLVDAPVVFASNRLVLIVPKDNPAGIEKVADVARPGVKLVVAGEAVPAGSYARTVLERLNLNAALDNVVSNESDVAGVVGKVSQGDGQAGFVYVTDVETVKDRVQVIEIPDAAQPKQDYKMAVVSASSNKEAAQAFVDRVTGPDGRKELEAAGFQLP